MSRHSHSFQLADSSSVFCSFCLSTNILDDFCQSTLSWCVMEENARPRKRRRFPSAWKKAKRKKNVVKGREHVWSSGSKKVIPGKNVTYRVGSANFSRLKIGHAHDNSADSENVAGACEPNVHAHFIFLFKNGQGNQSFFSIHHQNTAETSQRQAQPTDD